MTVHIIEDDSGVADSLSMLASAHDNEVLVYSNAEAYMSTVVPAANDLVILDLGLPGMNGSVLARWISQLKDRPKVYIVTGQTEKQIQSQLAGVEVNGLIRKPLDRTSLEAIFGLGGERH